MARTRHHRGTVGGTLWKLAAGWGSRLAQPLARTPAIREKSSGALDGKKTLVGCGALYASASRCDLNVGVGAVTST